MPRKVFSERHEELGRLLYGGIMPHCTLTHTHTLVALTASMMFGRVLWGDT